MWRQLSIAPPHCASAVHMVQSAWLPVPPGVVTAILEVAVRRLVVGLTESAGGSVVVLGGPAVVEGGNVAARLAGDRFGMVADHMPLIGVPLFSVASCCSQTSWL